MRDRASKSDSLVQYKEQASRLREFLGAAGIELKHTNALEAVAQMHGFRNFHLLQHASTGAGEQWLVSTITSGLLPITHLAIGVADAVAIFCHQLARVATDDRVEIDVRAQEDGPHRGLYATNYGALVVALSRPVIPKVLPRDDIASFEACSFTTIASALHDAVYERSGWGRFRERVHDEQFQAAITRGIDRDVIDGASMRPETAQDDPQVVLASRYLMGIAFSGSRDGGAP